MLRAELRTVIGSFSSLKGHKGPVLVVLGFIAPPPGSFIHTHPIIYNTHHSVLFVGVSTRLNRLLQVLGAVGLVTIVVTTIADVFTSSWIVGVSGLLVFPLLLTSVGFFAVRNTRYRRIKVIWKDRERVITIPSVLLLLGPVLLAFSVALFLLSPVSGGDATQLYALFFLGPGVIISGVGTFLVFPGWRMAKDVDPYFRCFHP